MKKNCSGARRWMILGGTALLWLSVSLVAQSPGTGAIAGEVSDASGAVVPNAHIFVVNNETSSARVAATAANGEFHVPLLQPGTYSVLVTALGFQQTRVPSVPVVVSETAGLKLTLSVGPVAAHVQVTEFSELAQPETSTLGRATAGRTINALPLANRNYSQILALSPGVLVELPNAAALGRNTQNVSANGAKTTSNNFQFNGVDANNLSENSASGYGPEVGIAIPAPDAISQFKVQTGNYDAGFGRGAGANVDVISKSGSNHLHGDLWEFFRNDALNANDFFLKRNGQRRPDLKQNQFGFTLGGPIPKTNTFFFGSYQATIQRDGDSNVSLQSAFLPQLTNDRTAAALGATFCAANHPNDPFYQTAGGGVQVACDGSNISPVALAFLQFKFPNGSYAIPSPQQPLPGGIGRSVFSIPARYREDQFSVNLDRTLFTSHQLAGRFFYSHAPTVEPFSPFGANVPGWGTKETDQNQMFVLSDTYIIKPDLINVARFGFIRFNGDAVIAQPILASQVGIATPSGLPETPAIAINGLFTIGTAGQPFYYQNTNTFVWQDTVSFTRGRHQFRMGGEAKRHQLALNVPFITDGFLFFLSFPDFLLGQSAAQNGSSTSNIFQSIGASGLFRKDERYSDFAGFLQDDVKLSPRFNVNAGLRYEIFGAPSEINGRLPDFNPAIASPQVPSSGSFSGFTFPANYHGPLPAGVIKNQGSGLWRPDYSDVGPRFGFSFQLLDRPTLLLRGGYGIYYERLSGQLAEQSVGQPPFSLKQSLQGAENAAATLQQPYNPTLPPNSSYPIFIPRTPGGALSLAAIAPRLTSTYAQQYDVNLQYEFAPDLLWQVGYVGSITSHLAGCTQFNQAFLASPESPVNGETTNTIENLVQRLPYAGVAEGSYICDTSFSANYNSLQTSVTRRYSHGLEFLASYTFSKNIDYTSGTGGLSNFDLEFLSNDQRNPRQARGLNDFDRTHRFVFSLVYQSPKLRSGSPLLRQALSAWQFSGLAVAQTGVPVTVIDSTAGSIYGNLTGFARAQCTGISPGSAGSTYNRLNGYFNPAAFAPAPVIGDGTGFGSCGVGILRGPGQRNVDAAIQHDIPIRETGALQFRSEFFNLTNTPNFGAPVNDVAAGPAFGVISSTVSNPRIIQFALKYKF